MTDPSPPEGNALTAAEGLHLWRRLRVLQDRDVADLGVLLAEYDRRGRQLAATSELVAAARAVAERREAGPTFCSPDFADLLDAVAARVKELDR
jgi:hypothetical protein